MNRAEQQEIMAKINTALYENDITTAIELAQKIPMPPEVAEALKFGFGAEALKESGFNLSEAEKTYGSNWLS